MGGGGLSGLPRQKGSHTFNGVVHFSRKWHMPELTSVYNSILAFLIIFVCACDNSPAFTSGTMVDINLPLGVGFEGKINSEL